MNIHVLSKRSVQCLIILAVTFITIVAYAASMEPPAPVSAQSTNLDHLSEKDRIKAEIDEKADEVVTAVEKTLPTSDYGGIWIDDADVITVGIVKSSATAEQSRATVLDIARTLNTSDNLRIVDVTYSEAYLRSKQKPIFKLLADSPFTKGWSIAVGLKTDENNLEITLSTAKKDMTSEQRALIEEIDKQYGDVINHLKPRRIVLEASCNWWFCNTPLRGGVGIKGSGFGYDRTRCTAGFIVKKGSAKYILTAGHCANSGSGWASETYSYTTKYIGNIALNLYGGASPIDAMLISIQSGGYWSQTGSILKRSGTSAMGLDGVSPPGYNETYSINDTLPGGKLIVGKKVCISGAITGGYSAQPRGGSCGKAKDKGSMISVGDGKYAFSYRASYCSRVGDSGAPIFSDTYKAYGIHRAADLGDPVCGYFKYFTHIRTIFNRVDGLSLY